MRKIFIIPTILLSTLFLSQSFETYAKPRVDEIQKNFIFKKYTKKILKEFSDKIGANEEEAVYVFESIPGEIIGWHNDRGVSTTSQSFRIVNGKLLEIDTIPTSDTFFNKLSKFNEKNKYFEFNSKGGRTYDAVFLKKQKSGKYLLTADLISIDNNSNSSISDFDSLPIYNIEYETLDFKNFKPLRIKKSESKEWLLIN